jgi:hypothetical protein
VRYEKIKNIMGIRGRKYAIIERWKILKLGLRHDLKGWRNRGGQGRVSRSPHPQILSDQLTLSQPGGCSLCSHISTHSPSPRFSVMTPPLTSHFQIGAVLSHLMWKEIE